MYRALTLYRRASHPVPFRCIVSPSQSYNPGPAVTGPVWAPSLSLATTQEIIVIFFSSAYLDVSVRRVCALCAACLQHAGLPHSEIRGSSHICWSPRLIAAYHVLHRLREPRHPPYTLIYFLPLICLLRHMVCFFDPPSGRTGQAPPLQTASLLLYALLFSTSSNMSKNFPLSQESKA